MKSFKEYLEKFSESKSKPANWDPENVIPCARCGKDIDFNDGMDKDCTNTKCKPGPRDYTRGTNGTQR